MRGLWNELLMKGWPLGEAIGSLKLESKAAWSDYRGHGDTSAGDWDSANAAAAAVNPYAIVPYTGAPAPKRVRRRAGNTTFFERVLNQRRIQARVQQNPVFQKGGGKGKGDPKGKGKKGKGKGKFGKGKGLPSGTLCQQDQGGAWFCVPYGYGGCREPCPNGHLHKCSVRIAPKTACKEPHPACEHFALGFGGAF